MSGARDLVAKLRSVNELRLGAVDAAADQAGLSLEEIARAIGR